MDAWEFADPVDILSKLPENFNEITESKKWLERKEGLEVLLKLATENVRLDPKANYIEIVEVLSKILAKDANINVAAVAAKCIAQLAKGLKKKFGPFAASLAPIIFEKFKEKKALLRDPLIEAIDAVYSTTNLDAICEDIVAALGKQNPQIKCQTNLFLYRVFKMFNIQTAPKKVVKTLTPLIAKCTGESDQDVREAAFSALGAIMKAIGKSNAMPMLGDVASDKTKMAQIEKFHDLAVEEYQKEVAAKASIEQTSVHASSQSAEIESQTTTSLNSVQVAEVDPWEFADPIDILPKLPENFYEITESKKWLERKEGLEVLLKLATENVRLDPKANYNLIVDILSKILAKDANINVAAVAAKCVTFLAKGLRTKFNPYAASLAPIIFEKFKEKKALLRDPLIEAIDAVYSTTNLDAICEDIVAALGKQNPQIKCQTNLFLYRVFKMFNIQTAPKKVVKTLTPLIAKCTGESDQDVREAAFSALGAIMKAIGKSNAMPMLGDVASDKTKMAQIEKFHDQAVEESPKEAIAQEKAATIHANAAGKDIAILQTPKLVAKNSEMKIKPQKTLPVSNEWEAKLDKILADNKNTSQQLSKALQRITELENDNKMNNQRIMELEKGVKNMKTSLQTQNDLKKITPMISAPKVKPTQNDSKKRTSMAPAPKVEHTQNDPKKRTSMAPAPKVEHTPNDPKKRTSMIPPPKVEPGAVDVQKAIASGSRLPVFPR